MREKRHNSRLTPNGSLLESFRVPVWATLLFVVTMFAIFILAGEVIDYYGLTRWPEWVYG